MGTQTFDDQVLMAYADGELDPASARSVERALASDAALATRVEAFRRSAALARESFAADLAQPVPDALLASVQAAIDRASVPAELPKPVALRQASWWARPANQPVFALAASFAVLAAGFLGYFVGGMRDAAPGIGLAAGSGEQAVVLAALRELPSGERRALDSAASVEMLASFRSHSGALCREFKLVRATASETTAIACRSGQDWAVAFTATAAAAGADYLPAGAHSAADAYAQAIGAGPPLTADEERVALSALR